MGKGPVLNKEECSLFDDVVERITFEVKDLFDAHDKENGRSGYKGHYKIQLGTALIRAANKIGNKNVKAALKLQGVQLQEKGRADNHPTRR